MESVKDGWRNDYLNSLLLTMPYIVLGVLNLDKDHLDIMLFYTNFVPLGSWTFVKITDLTANTLQSISFNAGEDRNSEGLIST